MLLLPLLLRVSAVTRTEKGKSSSLGIKPACHEHDQHIIKFEQHAMNMNIILYMSTARHASVSAQQKLA
jgi:hypothetical protein